MNLALFMFVLKLAAQVLSEECTTPDKNKGECISLYSCPVLAAAVGSQKNEAIEFVRRSNCGGTAVDPKVCCALPRKFELDNSRNYTNKDILSDRTYCGYQHSDDYFRPDNDTSLDEFPWLAYFLYQTENGTRIKDWQCNGVLISKRYVLTMDSCTLGLVGVRLGDNDIQTETDCVKNSPLDECSLPYEELGIETIIKYSGTNKLDAENVALVRLNRTLEYSDYIRPICLPQPSTAAKIGDTLVMSGWGFSFGTPDTPKKKRIATMLVSNEECSKAMPWHAQITANHMCTKYLDDTQSPLFVNFGGPVMFSIKSQWQLEGLVDIGVPRIDLNIKVSNYIEWIERNVQ